MNSKTQLRAADRPWLADGLLTEPSFFASISSSRGTLRRCVAVGCGVEFFIDVIRQRRQKHVQGVGTIVALRGSDSLNFNFCPILPRERQGSTFRLLFASVSYCRRSAKKNVRGFGLQNMPKTVPTTVSCPESTENHVVRSNHSKMLRNGGRETMFLS